MTQQTITRNLGRVLREGDSALLSPEAYQFITLHMGHIAHFNRQGFASVYRDLRLLVRSLQTSEYSSEETYNRKWADELDRRGEYETAATVRAVVQVAEDWKPDVDRRLGEAQDDAELETAQRLAEKHGYTLTPTGLERG